MMNSFSFIEMYSAANQDTVSNLQQAENLMNLSISKIQIACQRDLPLRRSLLIASVLNRAQRAAADAIASLDCSSTQKPDKSALLSLKSEDTIAHDDIEMHHILGNDLLSEILCADDKPGAGAEMLCGTEILCGAEILCGEEKPSTDSLHLGDLSDNLRKRPRESVVMESIVKAAGPVTDIHDSKRLKEEEISENVEDWAGLHPGYNDMWIMPNIWTTPVVC